MGQRERIQMAYRGLGGKRTFYDGMITCSTLSGRAVCRLVWGTGRAETQDYLSTALAGIPEGFFREAAGSPRGYRYPDHAPLPGNAGGGDHLPGLLAGDAGAGKISGARDLPMCAFSRGMLGRCLLGMAVSTSCSRSTGFMRFRIRRPPGGRSFVYCGQAGSSAAASM